MGRIPQRRYWPGSLPRPNSATGCDSLAIGIAGVMLLVLLGFISRFLGPLVLGVGPTAVITWAIWMHYRAD
jgi:hypothetical protein